jgi:acetyl esterase
MPLHPFIETMLAQLAAAGRPPVSAGTPEQARALVSAARAALGAGPEIGAVERIDVPTRSGSVSALLLKPESEPRGLIVYLHGGGWVVGSADDFEALARLVVAQSGCTVLLPDYRLAPEHPFPAGLEDSEDATLFAAGEVAALCGRPVPLAIAGDSAGANLATVVARRLRGRVELCMQGLIYPVTGCDFDRPSYRALSDGMPLSRADMIWFFDHYAPAASRADPDISPLHAADLAGLPPAHLVTAQYDVLRDEGEAYAAALAAAGVPVTHRRIDGLTHGFARLHNHVDTARDAVAGMAHAIAAACRAAARRGPA